MDERFQYAEVRQRLIDALKTDLMGPQNVDEVLDENPMFAYIIGMLYPQTNTSADGVDVGEQEVEADIAYEDGEDYTSGEEDDNEPVAATKFKQQSSIGLPLDKVPHMTEKEYFTRGCTALLDAVGGAIHHIGNIHKCSRKEDVPEKTLFIITTDGYENASKRYDYETVRKMIERQKEKYGWEFLFLGANIDAAAEAKRFGISADRAVNYKCDEEGTALNYEVISEAVCSVRACKPLSADWKKRIDEDVKKRGK